MQNNQTTFTENDIRSFEPAMKIGLLATINADGLPHLTLITTLKASSPTGVVWGQFTEGLSKQNILHNPKTGFLIMSLDKHLWTGKAAYTHAEKSGPDYDFYNNTPMFRYNAYFGIHTAHYMDLVSHSGESVLPMNRIVFSAVKTMLARRLVPGHAPLQALNLWTMAFLQKLDHLKFLSYIDLDGYPQIVPLIQAQAANPGEVIFCTGAFDEEIQRIPPDAPVALLGMALSMEDVVVRGQYQGLKRRAGLLCGSVLLDWVYNPMPPAPAQIYPPVPLQVVRDFGFD